MRRRGGWPYSHFPNEPFELNRESPQARGLVSWWPTLGSRGANVLRDYGGRGLDGVFKGAGEPAWDVDGVFGAVLDFDGANDDIAIGTPPALDIPGEFSAFLYVNFHDITAGVYGDWLLSQNSPAGGVGQYAMCIGGTDGIRTPGEITIAWGNTLIDVSTANLQTSQWYHVGFTRKGSPGNWTTRIYINGVLDETRAGIATNPGTQTTLDIGGLDFAGLYLNGRLADIRINNIALSPAVIWQMAHDKKWDLYLPLRRWWALRAPSAGWQSVFGGRGMSPVGSAVIRPGAVM